MNREPSPSPLSAGVRLPGTPEPMHYWTGGLSDVLSEEGAQEFLHLAPHSEYVNVLGAAHMVAGDRNDHFGQAVIQFLSLKVPVGEEPVHAPHRLSEPRDTSPPDIIDVP